MSGISVVITAHNEGEEVQRTIDSVVANTLPPFEIVLVDDGSTDGSCVEQKNVRLVRHEERIGIVNGRIAGASQATYDAVAFLDAHQRVSKHCLNKCAELSRERSAIVWPCIRGLEDKHWTGHGAMLRQKKKNKEGLFDCVWRRKKPRDKISRCSSCVVPGYVMTRDVFQKVKPCTAMRGWGASEPAMMVKAFFTDVDILHLCGPLSRHLFRKKQDGFPYQVNWKEVVTNHGLVARVCFDDDTWQRYWWPKIFARHFEDGEQSRFDTDEVIEQHMDFQKMKRRPDSEFWRGLIGAEVPFR